MARRILSRVVDAWSLKMGVGKHPSATQLELPGIFRETETIDSVSDLTADDVERLKKKRPKALGIVCRRSDCERNLHCFDTGDTKYARGSCRSCGTNLIDWPAVRVRGLANVEMKFNFFDKEWIRHFFFHVPITPRIETYARKHGFDGLAQVTESQLEQPKMLRFMPALDYNQTAMLDGTIVHWGRHATACCCRACMRYWHDVPLDYELIREDIEYFKQLVIRYVQFRVPDLEEYPKEPATRSILNRVARAN
jgi:hypothetical protein